MLKSPTLIPVSITNSGGKFVEELRNHKALKKALSRDLEIERNSIVQERKDQANLGFKEGYREGSLKALNQLIEISRIKGVLINSLENHIVDIVTQVSTEVIGDELKTNKQSIASRVVRAIAKSLKDISEDEHPDISIKANPEDISVLHDLNLNLLGTCKIIEDSEISPGTVKIDTRHGSINTEPEIHLKHILEYLKRNPPLPTDCQELCNQELLKLEQALLN